MPWTSPGALLIMWAVLSLTQPLWNRPQGLGLHRAFQRSRWTWGLDGQARPSAAITITLHKSICWSRVRSRDTLLPGGDPHGWGRALAPGLAQLPGPPHWEMDSALAGRTFQQVPALGAFLTQFWFHL